MRHVPCRGTFVCLGLMVVQTVFAEISEFRNGLPFAREGFGVRRNFYMSGRLSVKVSDLANVFQVNYIGNQPHTERCFYDAGENSSFGRFMVLQVFIGERRYRLTFSNTVHYPFGYSSECILDGVRLRHEIVLDSNVLFRRIVVLDNPEGKSVRAICVLLNPGLCRTQLRMNGDKTALVGSRTDGGAMTAIEIGSLNPVYFPLNDRKEKSLESGDSLDGDMRSMSFRFDMVERQAAKEHVFWTVFNKREDEELTSARIDRVYSAFYAKRVKDARFHTGDEIVDNALDSCMTWCTAAEVDGCGAFRASPTYWVWGWDALVHFGVQAMTGRAEEVKRMLFFFRNTADPKQGILHAYGTRFRSVEKSQAIPLTPPVQLLYVVLLYDYYCLTGDRATLDDLLPFARNLVARARASVLPGEHLCRGLGFFPDNPHAVGQREGDISLINNAIYYQGLCAYADLADEGRAECEAVKNELVEKLWDEREGFWFDAYNTRVKVGRPHYPLYGMFYISPFAQTAEIAAWNMLADYMRRRFFNHHHLPMFSPCSESHLADGNQLGAYYPVVDRTYWNVMNAAGRIEALGDYRTILRRHWTVLTYPEGQTSDVWNNDPVEYSDELGNKQFFASKGWLADALEVNLGIKWTKKNLLFHAIGDGEPFVVENLTLHGKRLTIARTGKGSNAEYIFNGRRLTEASLDWDELVEDNRLEIICK